MAQFIEYTKDTPRGSEVTAFLHHIRFGLSSGEFLVNQMDQLKLDDASMALIEAKFGLPPGNGQAFYDLISNAYNALKGAATKAAIARLG